MTVKALRAAALGAACLLLGGGAAQAQQKYTAEQLVAKNLEARGGAARLDALNSVRFSGRLLFPGGFELTAVETRSKNAVRQDATIQGLTVIQAYDGSVGWRVNPFQGRRDAEQMSADEARQMADSGTIQGALLSSRTDGSTVTYQGIEDVDGTPAYKLQVAQKDGDQFTYFLDPDTFLEIKVVETRRIRGSEQISETELGDYEKVADVYFPMAITSGPQGSGPNQRQNITIEKAEANVAVQQADFAMPAAPAAK